MRKNSVAAGFSKFVISFFLSILTVAAVFTNGEKIGSFFSRTAVAGAVITCPNSAKRLVREKYLSPYAKPVLNENISVPRYPAVAEDENAAVNESRTPEEFVTPTDVIKMQKEYEEKYSSSEHGGEIKEMFYSSDNANAKYSNVFVRNSSDFSLDIEDVLSQEATLSIKDKSKPSVLIFHTHTTESYEMADNGWYSSEYKTRSKSEDRNMIRVGDEIEKQLTAAGFSVIHDRTVHDLQYNGAYSRSRVTVEKILKQYPTIQVVLDVHRDAIYQQDGTRIKPTCKINNKKCAQVMIITGCQGGDVEDFPRWEENLVFALKLQKQAQTDYEGLMRPVMFCNRKYNMDLTPCSLLLEFGSDSNTLEEAMYSGYLLGDSLAALLEEYVEK